MLISKNMLDLRCVYGTHHNLGSHRPWDTSIQDVSDPDGPTLTRPGTEAKIKVLCRRAMARVALFHPGDARF
jgi:hypothetical protein